jgi:signal transduction histidine kinase
LNGILGLSNMLLQSKLDADQQDSAEGVHASAEDLLETISRILNFSKLECRQHTLQSSEIDVRQMIHGGVANGRRRMAGKTIQFHTMLGSELPTRVRGDDAALQQILTHLVDNAVKFTDRGEVAVGAVKAAEHSRHLTLRFTVSDTGIGISPEAQTRLFQSFTQVDDSHCGASAASAWA